MEQLRKKAEMLNIKLTGQQLDQFQLYYEMLIEKNKVMNLTAITGYDEVIDKHFLDSILLGKVMDLQKSISVIDVGTGAGFPGIPLKLVYPELKVTLLDSLNKRVGFLREVISALNLKGITAIHGRAEDIGRRPEYREQYTLCVSRAVANLSILSEYCLPFVKVSGCFVAYKSMQAKDETMEAQRAIELLGGSLKDIASVTIPESEINRQLVLIEKKDPTPERYPRRAGAAAKAPL